MVRHAPWIVAVAVGLLAGVAVSVAEPEKKEVVVLSPKEGGKVSQSEDVDGQLNVPGWPVLLVKPEGDQPWWVQSPVDEVVMGKFTSQAQFGEADTKAGTKFKIVVVVAPSKDEARKFERGMKRKSLPAGLPRSEPVSVVRG
jgi:hypothetical protein